MVKRDLSEDIWGMFEGEFQQRIDRLSEDAAGVMRLISFLEQIQPTVFYKKLNTTVPSFSFNQIVQYAQKKISSQTGPEGIKDVFIDIAGETREAEKIYLEKIVADIFHQGVNSFEQQLKERLDLVDIFIDSVEYGSEQTTGEISSQFKQTLQLKGALDEGMMTAIMQRQPSALDNLAKAIGRSLKKVYLTRILRTIEHRLNRSFRTDIDKLLDADWNSIKDALIKSMRDGYQSSVNFRSNPNHPIIQKISQILNRQMKSRHGIMDITNLLREMAIGTQAAINQKTHQQGFRQVQYLKYQYLAADLIKDLDPTELSASVIAHLKETTELQKTVWGLQEIMSIIENHLDYKGLPAEYREEIEKHLESSVIKALYEHPLSLLIKNPAEEGSVEKQTDNQTSSIQNESPNISLEQRETIFQAFGQKVQRENYRQVMLRAISQLWIEHLTNMEALRVSVSLESYAQRDPLVEYKKTATDAFKMLLSNIRMAVVSGMFRLQFTYANPTAQKKKSKSKGKSRKRHRKKK